MKEFLRGASFALAMMLVFYFAVAAIVDCTKMAIALQCELTGKATLDRTVFECKEIQRAP